jgi:D-alanyl-lipoteichoic acid acyltransferase DltB (MBOAT superfamily)
MNKNENIEKSTTHDKTTKSDPFDRYSNFMEKYDNPNPLRKFALTLTVFSAVFSFIGILVLAIISNNLVLLIY